MESNLDTQNQSLEIKTSAGLKIISIKNILYVEAAGKCSIVYLEDLNTIISYHLLKWYENKLLIPDFFRCHNSFIVNCRFIDCYNHKEIILKDKKRISLSRTRISSLKDNLKYLQEELS